MHDSQYQEIRTAADIEVFRDISNGLHDSYITYVCYNSGGVVVERSYQRETHDFAMERNSLILHLFVTSLPEPTTFELVFEEVYIWQVSEYYYEDITCFTLKFLEYGWIFWANDICDDISDPQLKDRSYVKAKRMRYRKL